MPTITLSDETYAKLQSIAKPFVDSEDSTVSKAVDCYMKHSGIHSNGSVVTPTAADEALHQDPDAPDGLSHTRLLSASIDGRAIHRPKWNGIREDIHLLTLKRLGSYDALQKASGANIRRGKYVQNGYKYLPDGDFSIQGVDANLAWDHCLKLARTLNVPIKVTFEWREKKGAAHPGKRGALVWNPNDA